MQTVNVSAEFKILQVDADLCTAINRKEQLRDYLFRKVKPGNEALAKQVKAVKDKIPKEIMARGTFFRCPDPSTGLIEITSKNGRTGWADIGSHIVLKGEDDFYVVTDDFLQALDVETEEEAKKTKTPPKKNG